MNYDDMPAGREMDALVDRIVFGFYPPQDGMDIERTDDLRHWRIIGTSNILRINDEGPTPPYSTSISAAWEVVEKANLFDKYCIAKCSDGDYGIFHNDEDEGTLPIGSAPTAPLAICRAALKAAG